MSYRLSKLREEWDNWRPHLHRAWMGITGRSIHPRRDGFEDATHALVNAVVNFFRCFAYTLGHLAVVAAIIGIALWAAE